MSKVKNAMLNAAMSLGMIAGVAGESKYYFDPLSSGHSRGWKEKTPKNKDRVQKRIYWTDEKGHLRTKKVWVDRKDLDKEENK